MIFRGYHLYNTLLLFTHFVNSILLLEAIAHIPSDILSAWSNTSSVITSIWQTSTCDLIQSDTSYIHKLYKLGFSWNTLSIHSHNRPKTLLTLKLVPVRFTAILSTSNLYVATALFSPSLPGKGTNKFTTLNTSKLFFHLIIVETLGLLSYLHW